MSSSNLPTKYFLLIGVFVLSASCGKPQIQHTSIKGHFEQYSQSELLKHAHQQIVASEYAPAQGVIISRQALGYNGFNDLLDGFFAAGLTKVWIMLSGSDSFSSSDGKYLAKISGNNYQKIKPVAQISGTMGTVWARDWSPLIALSDEKTSSKKKPILLDLNYYPERSGDDSTPRSLAPLEGWQRISLPVYNEGGNFMITGDRDCFMTTRVTDANASRSLKYLFSDKTLNEKEIAEYYMDYAGCKRVTIFPRMAFEKTGHIDMWGKFIDDKTILVSELQEKTVQLVNSDSNYLKKVITLRDYFNERAKDFALLGYEVRRIPMPLPLFDERTFRSYTNSLTLNGHALVPRYVRQGAYGEYPDHKFLADYESEVKAAYELSGYQIRFIQTDDLIAQGGAIHCVTMQVPQVF